MLCSKCHENIPQGKEMQVEGTIICKECILLIEKENREKVIARCWNCNQFLYKRDLIHESFRNNSKNFSKWFSIGLESSEKLFQCDECYQLWRSKEKKIKNFSTAKSLLLGVFFGFFLGSATELIFPELDKRMRDNKVSTAVLIVSFVIIIIILGPILEIDRHEFRKKTKSKKE